VITWQESPKKARIFNTARARLHNITSDYSWSRWLVLNTYYASSKPTVLLVGATGDLGCEIAKAILKKQNLELRILLSAENRFSPWGKKLLRQFSSEVLFVEGQLFDRISLINACEGVDAVISVVKGSKENILMGQLNLIEAASSQGVRRMIPSDYSMDYRKFNYGDSYSSDMRKMILSVLEESRIHYTLILSGVATELLFSSVFNIFDFSAGTFNYWGDGKTLFDTTTIEDTANYVVEAMLDPEMANAALQVAGTVLSMRELLLAYELVTGNSLKKRYLGSIKNLEAEIAKRKDLASSPNDYLAEEYLLSMLSGKGKLDALQNNRYPNIVSTTVSQCIRKLGL
jgi:nucleoside-diphosphate-sugar epimerase